MIKALIAWGIGFSSGIKYIITRGLGMRVAPVVCVRVSEAVYFSPVRVSGSSDFSPVRISEIADFTPVRVSPTAPY